MARYGLVLVRALLLVAITASAMLVADHSTERPAFCAEGSGCAVVQASGYATPLGVPLPFVGLWGFGALFLLSFMPEKSARGILRLSLLAAGAIGVALLALQAQAIGAFCPLCVAVDSSAVALGALGLVAPVFRGEHSDVLPVSSQISLLVLAVAAPVVWSAIAPPAPAHPTLQALFEREGVRIIEVADFTCPHCRALYPRLEEALQAKAPKQRVHRVMIPATAHPRAVEAASAYSCAESAGAGEAMAALLFDESTLAMPANEWARGAGLDPDELARCMTSEGAARSLSANEKLVETLAVRGLPTTFIGDEVLLGAVSRQRIERALDHVDRRSRAPVPPRAVFGMGVAALAGASIGLGLRAQRRRRTVSTHA